MSARIRRVEPDTPEAERFYARLDWRLAEQFDWNGTPMVLMTRELR